MLVEYPYIPPSTNKIYRTNRYGRRFLTSEGEAYKSYFKRFLIDNYFNQINNLNIHGIYSLEITLYMKEEDLVNKKFGKDKRIKSAYKTLDADNRIKLIQDGLAEAIGIDDSRFFSTSSTKMISDEVKVELNLIEQNIERYKCSKL